MTDEELLDCIDMEKMVKMVFDLVSKFDVGDKVVIIDNDDKSLMWDKGEVVDNYGPDDIVIWIKEKFARIHVNDRQIIPYDDIKELLEMTGEVAEEDFSEWDSTPAGSRDLPLTPDEEAKLKCVCDMQELLRYGCRCDVGRKELENEDR